MGNKMLVTQALDERDLLTKKIADKIERADFIDRAKVNEEKVAGCKVTREEFAKNAQAAYQQIMDLIDRYQKIDAAIVASNATTKIQTSYGEFTVAGAISLRSRLRGANKFADAGADFEGMLADRLERTYEKSVKIADFNNEKLQETAETMRYSILGKETRVKDDMPLEVVDAYVRENKTELVDPLEIKKKVAAIREKHDALLAELDTQIKVSNATTFIEV